MNKARTPPRSNFTGFAYKINMKGFYPSPKKPTFFGLGKFMTPNIRDGLCAVITPRGRMKIKTNMV